MELALGGSATSLLDCKQETWRKFLGTNENGRSGVSSTTLNHQIGETGC